MPRKRNRVRFSVHTTETPEHPNPKEVTDHDLVRATLVDFEEASVLPDAVRERFVEDLVFAIRLLLAGVDAGKHGLSNKKEAQSIFVENVGRALERAGLRAPRWRKRYESGGGPDPDAPESPLFRLARELADAFGRTFPKDPRLAGQKASKIRYGEMSPTMGAEQDDLLLAAGQQQHLGDHAARLRAAKDAELVWQHAELNARRRRRREVWGDHLVEAPRYREDVASAYLGFPFYPAYLGFPF